MSWSDSTWGTFSADPRDPGAEGVRASDRDRQIVLDLLAESYGDGRLEKSEYDERVDHVSRAKTLGELPPLVADLVPPSEARRGGHDQELHERAVRAYEASRRDALVGMLSLGVVLSGIWFVISGDGFYWPVFVLAAALVNFLRLVMNRRDVIEKEQRRLEAEHLKGIDPPTSEG